MMHDKTSPMFKHLLSLAACVVLGLGQALAQDATLFQSVDDNEASRMLQETLVDVSAGVVLDMRPVVHAAPQQESRIVDVGSPCPPNFKRSTTSPRGTSN